MWFKDIPLALFFRLPGDVVGELAGEKIEEFEPGRHSYIDTLTKIKACQARVYFLYARWAKEKIGLKLKVMAN